MTSFEHYFSIFFSSLSLSPSLPLSPISIIQVFTRTLQNPNSSRYRRLIDELFSQQNPKLMELNFFIDPKIQDSKKGLDKVLATTTVTIIIINITLYSLHTDQIVS